MDISFINIEAGGEYVSDKQSRLDLLVVTTTGERINVEIQFTDQYNMIKRSIYYWSGIYRSQLKTGMGYKELKSVISINVMNFNMIEQTERFHTFYHLHEDVDNFRLTNVMEFHFIYPQRSATSKLQASFYDKSTSIQTKGRPIKTGLCAQHRRTPFAGACFLYLGRSLPVCTLLNERFRFYYRNAKVIKSLERGKTKSME